MSFMMMKKIYFLAFVLFACGGNDDAKKTTTPPKDDEPKQYGTPFASVPDVENIVMYEVNTRAFSSAGDFQGVIDRLDNIKALGINTIWLMPIHPVGQIKSAGGLGSPYSVQDYLKVNTEFGDLAKLRELVEKAHDRNMAVIIDWVANHTAWDNPWIAAHKSWYTQVGSGNIIIPPGTNWQDVADLNYSNQEMRKAMIHAMKYWTLEANIDGFRCDAVDFVPSDFWKQAIDTLKAIEGRELILLGEGSNVANLTAGFQMNYAWDFYTALKKIYNENKAATTIFTTHTAEYSVLPAGKKKLRYTTNHDISAWEDTPVTVFGGIDAAVSASVITTFTSAVPLIYSSQEVGRLSKLSFFTRDPISWSSNQDMEQQYETILSIYNSSQAFSKGTLSYFADQDAAIFERKLDSDDFLIIVNVRNTTKEITLDASLQNTSWTNAIDESAVSLGETVSLDAYKYLILKK
jgi:glycosidase